MARHALLRTAHYLPVDASAQTTMPPPATATDIYG